MTPSHNQVVLEGTVSIDPVARQVPSGDEVVSFRVVVRRTPAELKRSKQRVDTIECDAWTATSRRGAHRLSAGDSVRVTGSLRRRFRRVSGAPSSWVSVEVARIERL